MSDNNRRILLSFTEDEALLTAMAVLFAADALKGDEWERQFKSISRKIGFAYGPEKITADTRRESLMSRFEGGAK